MTKCLLVTERDGTYEIQPNVAPEDWTDVAWEADSIRYIEKLEGRGEWVSVWRVYRGCETLTYFLGESDYPPEARRALAQVYDLLLRWGRERIETEESSERRDQKPLPTLSAGGEESQGS
jgi:hypothetical protein